MLLTPYRPFDSLFAPILNEMSREMRTAMPLSLRVDIHQTEDGYTLTADLPGVKKEDLHLDVKDNTLTISADVNTETACEEKGYLCRERRSGHVERSFNLEGIDEAAITAAYENGVLTLQLPKQKPLPEEEPRRIPIA